MTLVREHDWAAPTRADAVLFALKAGAFRLRRLWRDAPGFWQRYAGTLDPDGTTITGTWELSKDGLSWNHDFDLSYRRIA